MNEIKQSGSRASPQEFGLRFGLKIKSGVCWVCSAAAVVRRTCSWNCNLKAKIETSCCAAFSIRKSGVSCSSPQFRGSNIITVMKLNKQYRSGHNVSLSHSFILLNHNSSSVFLHCLVFRFHPDTFLICYPMI